MTTTPCVHCRYSWFFCRPDTLNAAFLVQHLQHGDDGIILGQEYLSSMLDVLQRHARAACIPWSDVIVSTCIQTHAFEVLP